ncbi:MAG: DIP1984 family protein [Erysipelotrichaceae bacterium]|nr:DIP1984 family protein [Erysipelotrichaceae bacterium]
MKLAEALQQRADLNIKISELRHRLSFNLVVQEGEKPAEDPKDLINELNSSFEQLEQLIKKINLTNCNTLVDGKSLTEWIAEKDCLRTRIDAYRDIVSKASNLCGRMTRTEIKYLPTVDARDIQKTVDTLSAKLRKVDNLIQQTNWSTDI